MKYIFLDIDGVLNAPGDTNLIEGVLDVEKYTLFKKLVERTNSKVVIISSRRIYKEDKNVLLKALDDIYDNLMFISYELNFKYRCDEILHFLKSNPCSSFVILDDIDSRYSKNEYINNHYVSINGIVGFTVNDYEKALELLK